MRAIFDKESSLWKWGLDGEAKYKTKKECVVKELMVISERLREIKKKIDGKNRV